MLTATQVAAIIILLQAFGVSPSVISVVRADITPMAYIAPTQPYIPPVVQSPVQTPTTPVVPVLGAVVAPVVACSNTPVTSLSFDHSSINLETSQSSYIEITANVVDGCGKTYPYNLMEGSQYLKSGLSTTGTTSIGITGSNIWQWESQNGFGVCDTSGDSCTWTPFPVTVSTATASSTDYISVQ